MRFWHVKLTAPAVKPSGYGRIIVASIVNFYLIIEATITSSNLSHLARMWHSYTYTALSHSAVKLPTLGGGYEAARKP